MVIKVLAANCCSSSPRRTDRLTLRRRALHRPRTRPRLTMHLYRRLVRYDDTEATPTAFTKPEEMLLRLPSEYTRADAVRVGGEFGVAVSTIECCLVI